MRLCKYIYESTYRTFTFEMSASLGQTRLVAGSRKRKKNTATGKQLSAAEWAAKEAAVDLFWNRDADIGGLEAGRVEVKRTRTGMLYGFPALELPEDRDCVPPEALAPEDTWVQSKWVPRVGPGEGKATALWFPAHSELIPEEEFQAMRKEAKERCIPVKTEPEGHWLYCARNQVDRVGEDGKVDECFYAANSVRAARPGETPNCRLVEDWNWKPGDKGDRCMLVSICKTQYPVEWKLDVDYARWMQGHDVAGPESDAEASLEEVRPEVRRSRRSKSAKEDSEDEFQERVVSWVESCAMSTDALRTGDALIALEGALTTLGRGQDSIKAQVRDLQRQMGEQLVGITGVLRACLKEQVAMKQLAERFMLAGQGNDPVSPNESGSGTPAKGRALAPEVMDIDQEPETEASAPPKV